MAKLAQFSTTKFYSRRATQKQQDFLDVETQRQAKRIGRQQKRLEKETGLNVVDITTGNTRQRVVKLQDIKEIKPLTDTQYDFFESWADNAADGYVLFGSAGTGKTMIAIYHAILDVLDHEVTNINKLIIIRSSVQSREQGHLPGDINEKMEAFQAPYHSIFSTLTGKKDAYEKLVDMGKLEFHSTSFLRGDTFDNAIIIFDEFQNSSWEEISTVATRLGKNSKIIFCGDGSQDDLHFKKNDVSGFKTFLAVSSQMPEFRSFRFRPEDIVRSGFVKSWITTCERLKI
jgi:phosphate starvation-inducible PhoH-like protein